MANQVGVGRALPKFNQSNVTYFELTAPGAMAQNETFTITLPGGVEDTMLPISAIAFTNATPAVAQPATITSHNRTTGVTVLTASGAAGISAAAKVVVTYVDA